MDKKEAIYYLQYLRHDVHANSPYDVAIVTAINALSETAPPKSNADRIRQMTDEELAAFIDIYDIEDICRTRCSVVNYQDCMAGEKCKGNILLWLKQEGSEDETERTD